MAEMVDFYPTLAELAGLPKPQAASGVSLVPALNDPQTLVRDSALTQFDSGYSLRTAEYRFTQWGPNGRDGMELYDRRNDPGEMNNVADDPKFADVVQKLRRRLGERIAEAGEDPPGTRLQQQPISRRVRGKR
jgi:arylsulfatase A-like enzyme